MNKRALKQKYKSVGKWSAKGLGIQNCHKVCKSGGGGHSNVVGIMCPPG